MDRCSALAYFSSESTLSPRTRPTANSIVAVSQILLDEAKGDKLTVNLCMLEHSCWNFVLEHQVDLTKSAVLGLGQAVPAPNSAKKIGPSIEEACLCAPVPTCEIC